MAGGKLARVVICAALTLGVLPGCGRFFFDWTDHEGGTDASSDASSDALVPDANVLDANVLDANDDAQASDATFDATIADDATVADAEADSSSLDGDIDGNVDAGSCTTTNCGCVRFVNDAANSQTQDGLTWATAFIALQPAIDSAAAAAMALGGNAGCDVWVRAGRYVVFQTSVTDTITMRPRIDLYGGFSGGETDRNSRDPSTKVTILDGNELAVMNPRRVYHVVTGTGPARIDGFTITGGHAVGTGLNRLGAGLLSNGPASPLVVSCTFEDNDTDGSIGANGGGAAFIGATQAQLQGCLFLNNSARDGGGLFIDNSDAHVIATTFNGNQAMGAGGAIASNNTELEIIAGHFFTNQSNGDGGAISVTGTNTHSVRIEKSELRNNTAGGSGGAVAIAREPVDLENNVIGSNTAGGTGGGVALFDPAMADIRNVTIANNIGGGAFHASCPTLLCAIRNSILWNPGATAELSYSGNVFFTYSIARGGVPGGTFILDTDPLLQVSPPFSLGPGSPAIDAADGCAAPATDFANNARFDVSAINNTGVGVPADLGAIERIAGGTSSPWNVATCCGPAAALPNGNTGYFCPSEVPWSTGQAFCVAVGGNLASIGNAGDAAAFEAISSQDSWIGLRQLGPPGSYRWEDATPFAFTDWGLNQPTGGAEGCVLLSANNTWSDDLCARRVAVLCEVP